LTGKEGRRVQPARSRIGNNAAIGKEGAVGVLLEKIKARNGVVWGAAIENKMGRPRKGR